MNKKYTWNSKQRLAAIESLSIAACLMENPTNDNLKLLLTACGLVACFSADELNTDEKMAQLFEKLSMYNLLDILEQDTENVAKS
jgi:hypothetical protein